MGKNTHTQSFFPKRLTAFFLAVFFTLFNSFYSPISAPAQIRDHAPQGDSLSGRFPSVDAVPNRNLTPNLVKQFGLPADLGLIQDSFQGSTDKVVVYIQDAHTIYEAQKSIQKIIDYFQTQYGLNLIALEGGSGKLDPLLFRTFPKKEVLEGVFEDYLAKGELSGAAAAAVLNDRPADFYAIEDESLYEKGIIAYHRALAEKPEFLNKISHLEKEIEQAKSKLYPRKLLELDRDIKKWWEEDKDLAALLLRLQKIRPPEKFPHLKTILDEIRNDRPQNESILRGQIKNLIAELKPQIRSSMTESSSLKKDLMEFNEKLQAYETSQSSSSAMGHFLLQTAKKMGMKTEKYAVLEKATRHYPILSQMQGSVFSRELETYLRQIRLSFISSPPARFLNQLEGRLKLLKRLANLELTREEWETFKRDEEKYRPWVFEGFLSGLSSRSREVNGVKVLSFEAKPGANFPWDPYKEFYSAALRRDQIFLNRLSDLMKEKKSNQALLLTDGFHSTGITEAFRKGGISYLLISPRMTYVPRESPYERIMKGDVSWRDHLGDKRKDLYEIFASETLDRLLSHSISDNKSRLLKIWRVEIIRRLAFEGRIAESEGYTHFIDDASYQFLNIEEQSNLKKQWRKILDQFVERLMKLVGERKLDKSHLEELFRAHAFMPELGVRPLIRGSRLILSSIPQEDGHIEDITRPLELSLDRADAKGLRSELRFFNQEQVDDAYVNAIGQEGTFPAFSDIKDELEKILDIKLNSAQSKELEEYLETSQGYPTVERPNVEAPEMTTVIGAATKPRIIFGEARVWEGPEFARDIPIVHPEDKGRERALKYKREQGRFHKAFNWGNFQELNILTEAFLHKYYKDDVTRLKQDQNVILSRAQGHVQTLIKSIKSNVSKNIRKTNQSAAFLLEKLATNRRRATRADANRLTPLQPIDRIAWDALLRYIDHHVLPVLRDPFSHDFTQDPTEIAQRERRRLLTAIYAFLLEAPYGVAPYKSPEEVNQERELVNASKMVLFDHAGALNQALIQMASPESKLSAHRAIDLAVSQLREAAINVRKMGSALTLQDSADKLDEIATNINKDVRRQLDAGYYIFQYSDSKPEKSAKIGQEQKRFRQAFSSAIVRYTEKEFPESNTYPGVAPFKNKVSKNLKRFEPIRRHVDQGIGREARNAEKILAEYLAIRHLEPLPYQDKPELSDEEYRLKLKEMDHRQEEFHLSMILYYFLNRQYRSAEENRPVIVFIDPSAGPLLTFTDYGKYIDGRYGNIEGTVDTHGTSRSHYAIHITHKGGVAVTGAEWPAGRIQSGVPVIIDAATANPLAYVYIYPTVKKRTEMYRERDRLNLEAEYYQSKANEPVRIGKREFHILADVSRSTDLTQRAEEKVQPLPVAGTGLLRLENLDVQWPGISSDPRRLAAELTDIMNSRVFSDPSGAILTRRLGVRLADPTEDRIPEILTPKGSDAAKIVKETPGIDFYLREKEVIGNTVIDYWNYGVGQLTGALVANGRSINRGRLNMIFPRVETAEHVEKIELMLNQAIEEAAAELFAKNSKIGLKEWRNWLKKNTRIIFMIETIKGVKARETLIQKSNAFSVGTNDLMESIIQLKYPEATRSNSKYADLFKKLTPQLIETLWVLAQEAKAQNKPFTICGEWGESPMMSFFAAALYLKYDVEVYPVSSIPNVPRLKEYMRQVKPGELENFFSPLFDKLEQGENLQEMHIDGLYSFGRLIRDRILVSRQFLKFKNGRNRSELRQVREESFWRNRNDRDQRLATLALGLVPHVLSGAAPSEDLLNEMSELFRRTNESEVKDAFDRAFERYVTDENSRRYLRRKTQLSTDRKDRWSDEDLKLLAEIFQTGAVHILRQRFKLPELGQVESGTGLILDLSLIEEERQIEGVLNSVGNDQYLIGISDQTSGLKLKNFDQRAFRRLGNRYRPVSLIEGSDRVSLDGKLSVATKSVAVLSEQRAISLKLEKQKPVSFIIHPEVLSAFQRSGVRFERLLTSLHQIGLAPEEIRNAFFAPLGLTAPDGDGAYHVTANVINALLDAARSELRTKISA